jgi:hypothetical protein
MFIAISLIQLNFWSFWTPSLLLAISHSSQLCFAWSKKLQVHQEVSYDASVLHLQWMHDEEVVRHRVLLKVYHNQPGYPSCLFPCFSCLFRCKILPDRRAVPHSPFGAKILHIYLHTFQTYREKVNLQRKSNRIKRNSHCWKLKVKLI